MDRLKKAAILTALARKMRERGSWCGETHLQKAVYLLQTVLGVPTGFTFVLYKHGPFSFDFRDELTSLRADSIFALESQPPPYGPKIAPTELSERLRQLYPKTSKKYEPHLSFVAEHVSSKGVSDLERMATALYVTSQAGKGATVLKRAKLLNALKPHINIDDAKASVEEADKIIAEAKAI